jgi:predicted dehydrogenase
MFEGRAEVVATCDTVSGRHDRVERFLGHPAPFTTDYRDLVARDDVDVVAILTAMPVHGEIAAAALAAGKHVLVEKPMSVDLDEAATLVDRSQAGSELLVCAPFVVLSPTFRAIWKRVVAAGEIGEVISARARYGWSGPTWGQWYYRTGGGPLFDLGVYNITSLTGLMGSAQRVTAMAGTAIPTRTVDGEVINVENYDNYQIVLDFGDGRVASVTTGFTMPSYRSPAIELYGTNGVIQMLGDDWAPEGYETYAAGSNTWSVHGETDKSWPWTAGLRHMVDCLLDGTRLLVEPSHAYHCLEIMIKAGVAASTGQTQEISSRVEPLSYRAAELDAAHSGGPSHDTRIHRDEDD